MCKSKKISLKLLSCLLIAVYITGCSSQELSKEDVYTGVGAGAGAILVSALGGDEIMSLAGAVTGAYFGDKIGKEKDKQDKKNE